MEPHALSNLVIVPWTLAQLLALFLLSTVVFDVIHVLLHHFVASRFAWLRALGMLHERHHRFVDANLDVHEEYTADNLRWHVIPEFLTQVVFSLCLLWLLCAPVVLGVMALQTLVFLLILRTRGRDLNHRPIARLRAYRPSFFCVPEYHALHHAYPQAHFSSWIKLLDYTLQTGMACTGRRVAVVGTPQAFTEVLVEALAALGVTEVASLALPTDAESSRNLADRLRLLDILVLDTHALGGAASVTWVERFTSAAAGRKLPPEVWVLSLHTALTGSAVPGSTALQNTVRYWTDARVIYRHIDLPERAFRDAGVAHDTVRRTIRSIRRGYNYISVRGFMIGIVGCLRFRLEVLRASWRTSDGLPHPTHAGHDFKACLKQTGA